LLDSLCFYLFLCLIFAIAQIVRYAHGAVLYVDDIDLKNLQIFR